MGRRRTSHLNLPPRMHLKDGIYYHVTSQVPRKWTKLDKDLSKARILWAQIESSPDESDLFSTKLDEYLVSAKFTLLAKNTKKAYEYVADELRSFFANAKLSDIKPSHIALWMDNHKSNIRANTGKSIVATIFDAAIRHGLVNLNPARVIRSHVIHDRDRVLTDDEYRSIWKVAQEHVQIAMDIGYLTGSRIQDILDIKLSDISEEGIYIRQGKTKKRMLFLMAPALAEVVQRAKRLPRPVRGMNLICTQRGQPYSYATFNRHWLQAVRQVGIEGLHFHDIRGKAATDAKDLGMDYQKLLGHTTKAMSDKYIKVRGVDKVEPLPAMKTG